MELLIDTQRCDLPLQEIQLPRLDLSRLGEVAAHREGRTLSLRLPATPTNDRIFGFARDPEGHPLSIIRRTRHFCKATAWC